jgi:hypothetical protein
MIYVCISFYLICVYRSILYNNPSTHLPNTLYYAGMQCPRKLGQGHIGLGRIDIVPFVLALLRKIQDHRHSYIDLWCGRLFGLAWLEADEKKFCQRGLAQIVNRFSKGCVHYHTIFLLNLRVL